MVTVKVSIPELNTNSTSSVPKIYAWFAFFWTDHRTFTKGPELAGVHVPPSPNIRNAFLDVAGEGFAPVPASLGSFSIKLDDTMAEDNFGVIALVFGQFDTPDDAIASGYSAFRSSITTQLNAVALAIAPEGASATISPDQVTAVAAALKKSISTAIKDTLSDWDKFLSIVNQEKADVLLGYSYVFFSSADLVDQQNAPLKLPRTQSLPGTPGPAFDFPSATITVNRIAVANLSGAALAAERGGISRL